MKKATKKILTLALSTLFVGAGIGGTIAAYDVYNATVASAAIADMTKVDTAIDCAMPLEEGKVKNISSWGYYDSNADGVGDVWAFKGDGNATAQPEIRFSTPGTDTTPGSSSRVYKPMTVNKITVEYNITNSGTALAESSTTPYLLQILGANEGVGSTNAYYYHIPEIIADGEWHTLTIDLNSAFGGGKDGLPTATTFNDIKDIVCCWNFKIGQDFNGEVMFRNFQVERPAAPAINLAEGASNGNWNNGNAFGACWMYRIWLPNGAWTSTAEVSKTTVAEYAAIRDNIKINGKSINEWTAAYKAGETPAITWPEMDDTSNGWGSIVGRLGAFTKGDVYSAIDATLCYHGGGHANSLDIYVAKSMFPNGINSIELTAGFEFVDGDTTYNFGNGVTYYGNTFSYVGTQKATVETVSTTVTKAYHTDSNGGALYFYLGTHDYPQDVGDYVLPAKVEGYNEFLKQINYYDYIELDGVKLGTALNGNQGETFINVWGRKGTYSIRWPSTWSEADRANLQEIKILKGAQFPSYENTLGKVFEVQEDITLVRGADGEFTNPAEAPVVPELTNVDVTNIGVHGRWGTGDYSGNMAHIRLNIAGDITWAAAGVGIANNTLPATVLDNVWVNGKSISQHNAEYKALIESGKASPITWDSSSGFNSEIASDVNNGTAVYAPIYIKLVNHGAGLAGNTIDIYIPNSYLSASDITELRITKDFYFETETAKFTVSDNIIFKTNSLRKPIKYIGQAPQYNLNIQETTVEKIDGSHLDGDAFLSFYLGNSDYSTAQTPWSGSLEFLKNINYFDYILIDGVKIGELWNYVEPGEIFMNVWNRPGSFATRWPNSINNTAGKSGAKEITILAGCQFPSMLDPTGTVYQVNETTTFKATEGGAFVNEKYLINKDDITIAQATDVGEAMEMIMFEISYANWNSTRDSYDFNYFGDQFTAMRKHIFINGVSLWNINTTVDDSGYNYATGPWSNGDAVSNGYQLFQNPTLVRGEGNKLMIYVHKDYLDAMGINELTVTVGKNFCHSETPAYVVAEDVSAKVWTRPVTVSFDTNGGSIVESITVPYNTTVSQVPNLVPTKAGYEFAGWTANGAAFTAETIVTADTVVTANWTIITYTATVTVNGVDTTIEFTVENRAEKLAEIAAMLPESTMDYTYAWATALPAELALNNDQAFVVEAVANFTAFDFVMDEYINVTVSADKFARTEFYSKAGGYIIVDYWMDIIVTVNGTEYYAYEPIPLKRSMEGANIITITSATGAEVTDEIMFMAYVQPGADLAIGTNEVDIVDAQAGREAYFTAPMAGTYTFKLADGEENGVLTMTIDNVTEVVELPYTVTLDEYEMITFGVATMNWQSDVIDIVVEAPFATGDIWVGEENTISIPEGKYFFTNVSAFMGGSFVITWTGDITVEINGVAIENGDMVELNDMWTGSNSFLINSINGSAVEATLTIAEYKEPATEITLGNVDVTVSVENSYCAGVEVVFTATEAGEYTISAAEGEENADISVVMGNVTEWLENLPYTFTLEAGESITFIIATSNMMVETDEINLVLAKAGADVEEPEEPGTSETPEEPEEPGTSEEPEEPGTSEEPEEPGTSEEPTDEPSILDQVQGMIPGCSGVVGGIAGGVAALGIAAVALLKKKEDNE